MRVMSLQQMKLREKMHRQRKLKKKKKKVIMMMEIMEMQILLREEMKIQLKMEP